MRTILIVDDDRTIREGLSLMLHDIEPQARVLMAGTGAEALEAAMRFPVDLILTDVKMPVMDGLELVENLRRLNFSGEAVIISGFDEFDFVRKALKLGAADYLLKPVKAQELRAVCGECARRLREKKQPALSLSPLELSDNPHVQQARLIGLLADSHAAHTSAFSGLADSVFCLAADALSAGRAKGLREAIRAAARDAESSAMIQGEHLGLWIALCFAPFDIAQKLRRMSGQALTALGLRCGVSAVYDSRECQPAFLEAQAALSSCFYDELSPEGGSEEAFPYPKHSGYLIACAVAGSWAECGRAMREIFMQALADQPEADALRRHLSDMVYSLMNQDKDLIGIIGKYKLTDKDIMLKIREAQSFSQLRKDYQDLMLLYFNELKERRLSQDDCNIQRAKEYIENNYRDNVSLSEIAQRLGLHPNYFSTLFRQKTGETFSDYLRSARIAKAIELMNGTNMKVYEIASRVGYNDNAQFHRAFKQITGISPGQYKQKHT